MARYDSVNNMKASYSQNKDDKQIGISQLYTQLYIMYVNYYNNEAVPGKLNKYSDESGLNQFKSYFNPKLSRNKLCFLECNGVNNYACGCLSGTNEKYDSKCVELDDKQRNYGMIYMLNKTNKVFSQKIEKKNHFVL